MTVKLLVSGSLQAIEAAKGMIDSQIFVGYRGS